MMQNVLVETNLKPQKKKMCNAGNVKRGSTCNGNF